MSVRHSPVIVVVLLLLGVAQGCVFGQGTPSGPGGNFVRYEHQESPHGRWQLDYYEDPNGFGRQVWISENASAVGDVRTLEGKNICVTGKIALYKGKPEIVVATKEQIQEK